MVSSPVCSCRSSSSSFPPSARVSDAALGQIEFGRTIEDGGVAVAGAVEHADLAAQRDPHVAEHAFPPQAATSMADFEP